MTPGVQESSTIHQNSKFLYHCLIPKIVFEIYPIIIQRIVLLQCWIQSENTIYVTETFQIYSKKMCLHLWKWREHHCGFCHISTFLNISWNPERNTKGKLLKKRIQNVILILSRVTISSYDLIGCPEKNQGSRRRGGRGPEKFKRNQKEKLVTDPSTPIVL